MQGNDDEALQAYTEAKGLHPGYAAIHEGLGWVIGRAGKFEEAGAAFEEAIRLDGKQAEYYFEVARIYEAEGHVRKAIKALKLAKELEPDRLEILLALGNLYYAWEHFPEVVREYQGFLEKNPDMESARP